MDKQYFIRVGGQRVKVAQEVYLAYYRSKRRDRHFERDLKTETPIRDKGGKIVGYKPAKEDSLDRRMDAGEQFAAAQKSVEATVLHGLLVAELHEALDKLDAVGETCLHSTKRGLFVPFAYRHSLFDSTGMPRGFSCLTT